MCVKPVEILIRWWLIRKDIVYMDDAKISALGWILTLTLTCDQVCEDTISNSTRSVGGL
jgi:hypothetical protein